MIHPKEMTRVSILGPKTRMDTVVERLHEIEVLHLDEHDEEVEGVDIGEPGEEAEQLSDQLVKIRSVKSRLPEGGGAGAGPEKDIQALGDRVEEIEEELDRASREKEEGKEELLEKLEMVRDLGLDLDDFQDYRSLDIFLGHIDDTSFEQELDDGRYELFRDGSAVALFVDKDLDLGPVLRSAAFEQVGTEELVGMEGSVEDSLEEVRGEIADLGEREEELGGELESIGRKWRGELERREEELDEELEKKEAPLSFAVTDSAFIAEGWIPTEKLPAVERELEDASGGIIHVERLEETGEAPVEHDNPESVKPMESLLSVYGTPSYGEIDPSFLLLTFPLLFGFMLGDVGYGITTFAVFYGLYRKFPEAKGLWYSLMYASVATVAFGLVYGEMFGYMIFGHHSVLAGLTGLHAFEQIPILFHRTEHLSQVLYLSVLIGAVHVNAGFLIGAYNEYLHHGILEAFYAKGSWLVIEVGAVLWYLYGGYFGAPVLAAGVVLLFRGEGIEGLVEIPSLLSNILSYLRIFGVVMAVIALAAVVNTLVEPLFQSGSIAMAALGVGLLVIGHTFNTFLKLMESGLQGIRLHYVEFFTKFFEGGGEYYRPFGRRGRGV